MSQPVEQLDGSLLIDCGSDSSSDVELKTDATEEMNSLFSNLKTPVVGIQNYSSSEEDSTSSDGDAPLNRIGNIPLSWYDDEEHMGYTIHGKKLMKPSESSLSELLKTTDDPNALRTIIDPTTGERKVLSSHDLQLLLNMQGHGAPNPKYDADQARVEENQRPPLIFNPLNNPLAPQQGPSRLRFTPAPHELRQVRAQARRVLAHKDKETSSSSETEETALLWSHEDVTRPMDKRTAYRYHRRIPKPSLRPPSTYESYRPPDEYLPSESERAHFEQARQLDRTKHFLPTQYDALRHVGAYHHFVEDQFQRCLDLIAFPRIVRERLIVDPRQLLPNLPKPRDLRPFPERYSLSYPTHTGPVRSLSVSPDGQFLATGCDDHLVRIFEVQTGRLAKRYDVGNPVSTVAFAPTTSICLLAVAAHTEVLFIIPSFMAHPSIIDHTWTFLGQTHKKVSATGELSPAVPIAGERSLESRGLTPGVIDLDEKAHQTPEQLPQAIRRASLLPTSADERRAGIALRLLTHVRITHLRFHSKGDYVCLVSPRDAIRHRQVLTLQLSSQKVFYPFRSLGDSLIDCTFHPREPLLFVLSRSSVRCYHLLAQQLLKKFSVLKGGAHCLDIHPGGENFLVGTTLGNCLWFDYDYSEREYKRLKSDQSGITVLRYHSPTGEKSIQTFPLFASASMNGSVYIFYGKVFRDLKQNPQLVPLKVLKHSRPVHDIAWHPSLPWIFTATDAGTVTCWTE